MVITSKQFRHIKTGKIATQIPLMEINEWEEVRSKDIKSNKKLPKRVQLYDQMWMRNNGDIIYYTGTYETEPFRLNLQESAPKQYQRIIDTYGTSEGKKVRKQTFYGVAKMIKG